MSQNTFRYSFFSNFLNHHQLPFCIEMYRALGDRFRFIATEPIHPDRLEMGYQDLNNSYPFVVRSYEDGWGYEESMRLGYESDVVIIGSSSDCYIEKRISENKLTFRYSERIFKRGRWRILDPRMIISLYKKHTRYYDKKLYMLCASAYASGDFAMVGAYKNKCLKWGYFTEVIEYDIERLMMSKERSRLTMLWVGRFIELKHPEIALYVAEYLKKKGIIFTLKFIGGGVMEDKLINMMRSMGLEDCVEFLGYRTPDVVRKYMESSEIFIFTSDYNEGWGAVLNEAMNSGCAVVCSSGVGAVPFLIKDGVNGFIYKYNNDKDLKKKVMVLATDFEKRYDVGVNAYKTIRDLWNPRVAANRFIEMTHIYLNDKDAICVFREGPCSIAE